MKICLNAVSTVISSSETQHAMCNTTYIISVDRFVYLNYFNIENKIRLWELVPTE